ncbi:ABC transporter permease subunit [Cellulosimicrobium marinum]|uniref:ABC transporter permease subunit n=1 Tax=Cellulosimicrobium marinum TaxID=1638992 RepID=UPI001E5B6672|nr:ABC transporter permease subunit [Cellulosimicrobium marinum]MCB7137874.1 ABC transporter permease subunit [Cellulosimicrobium marinum]
MSRLLRVELRRLRARRLVRWAALVTVAVAVLTVVVAYVSSLPTSEAELAESRTYYEQARDDWEQNGEEYVAQCEEEQEVAQETDPTADYGCDQMTAPKPEDFTTQPPTFVGDEGAWPVPGLTTLVQLAPLLTLFALLVGVSFVTAEISTGAVGLWLTFEPRRRRVYWSKALAASLGVLPVVLGAYALMAGGAAGAYALNGQLGDVTASTWAELGAVGGRVAVAAALVAATGAALGALLKHAAAALGLAVGWFVVVENVLAVWAPEAQRWLVRTNLTGWVEGGTSYWVNECTTDTTGSVCETVERTVSQTQGGLVLLGLTVVLSLLAVLVFRRRDVS